MPYELVLILTDFTCGYIRYIKTFSHRGFEWFEDNKNKLTLQIKLGNLNPSKSCVKRHFCNTVLFQHGSKIGEIKEIQNCLVRFINISQPK